MKRTIVAITFIGILCIAGLLQAQDKPTLGELQWRAQAIQQEFRYLSERQKTLQVEFQDVQDQINALQAHKKAPTVEKDPKPIPSTGVK